MHVRQTSEGWGKQAIFWPSVDIVSDYTKSHMRF